MKKSLIVTSIVFCLLFSLSSSCKKNCFCEVKAGEDKLPSGYDRVWVDYTKEKKCPEYKDEGWDNLGYTYTCKIDE